MRALLAHRDLRIYLSAQALSMFGDSALWLALAIWAKSLTGSNSAAALVFFAFLAPALLSPAAGLLVDRSRRLRLLTIVNLTAAVLVSGLLLVRGAGQLWLIYAITLGYGGAYTVLGAGQSALLRTLVPDDSMLADANGALRTMQEAMRLLAPLAGAGLYTVAGGGVVALLDAATFLLAAGALRLLRVADPAPARPDRTATWRSELVAGIGHVRRTVPLRQLLVAAALTTLVAGFAETVIFAVVDTALHRPPAFVGVLEMAMAVGAVLGGLASARLVRRLGGARAAATGMLLIGTGAGLLAVPVTGVVLAGMAILGAGVPALVVALFTTLQRSTPAHLQGRAFAAVDVLLSTPQTASIALGAGLAVVIDYRLLIAAMVTVVLAAAGYLLTRPPAPSDVDTPATAPAADAPAADPPAPALAAAPGRGSAAE
ncbi:MAG TPA: MFS transporter [Mycobacteriales bacterium]|nr:MFS transporter [Mycobacteriales bacterium]